MAGDTAQGLCIGSRSGRITVPNWRICLHLPAVWTLSPKCYTLWPRFDASSGPQEKQGAGETLPYGAAHAQPIPARATGAHLWCSSLAAHANGLVQELGHLLVVCMDLTLRSGLDETCTASLVNNSHAVSMSTTHQTGNHATNRAFNHQERQHAQGHSSYHNLPACSWTSLGRPAHKQAMLQCQPGRTSYSAL